jgi:mono/diheme cytochrome c family protein
MLRKPDAGSANFNIGIAEMKNMFMASAAASMTALSFAGVMLAIAPVGSASSAGLPASADNHGALAPAAAVRLAAATTSASIERGRYLSQIGGCNDCHTPGYNEAGGRMPATEWLTGSSTGFRGPWGTSYPANLRLTVQSMSEEQWLQFARAERLPPMPWFNLAAMSDADLRDLYRFIRSLGPRGEPAPRAEAPGVTGTMPYILFVPQAASPGNELAVNRARR